MLGSSHMEHYTTATKITLLAFLSLMFNACATSPCKSANSQTCHPYTKLQNDDINKGKPLSETSGLTYNSKTNTLFTIVNKESFIYELGLDGSIIRRLKILDKSGKDFFFNDIEGIAYIYSEKDNSTFAIAEESKKIKSKNKAIVYFLEIPNSSKREIELPNSHIKGNVVLHFTIEKPNKGVEGIAVDVLQNNEFILYGVREEPEKYKPKFSIWKINKSDLNTAKIMSNSDVNTLNIDFRDYSGLHIAEDSTRNGNGSLFLISDKSKQFVEYKRTDGKIIDHKATPTKISIPQAEGITTVGDKIYIVSEYQYFESKYKIIQFFLDGLNFIFPAPSRFYIFP